MDYKLKALAKENIIFNGKSFVKGSTINGVFSEKHISQLAPLIDILEKTPLEKIVAEMKPVNGVSETKTSPKKQEYTNKK